MSGLPLFCIPLNYHFSCTATPAARLPSWMCGWSRHISSHQQLAIHLPSPAPPSCRRSAFAKLDVWLEQQNVLNELTQAPRTQMEGTLSPEQKEVGLSLQYTLLCCLSTHCCAACVTKVWVGAEPLVLRAPMPAVQPMNGLSLSAGRADGAQAMQFGPAAAAQQTCDLCALWLHQPRCWPRCGRSSWTMPRCRHGSGGAWRPTAGTRPTGASRPPTTPSAGWVH